MDCGSRCGSDPFGGAPTLAVRAAGSRLYVCTSGQGVYLVDNLTDQVTATQYNSANSALAGVSENGSTPWYGCGRGCGGGSGGQSGGRQRAGARVLQPRRHAAVVYGPPTASPTTTSMCCCSRAIASGSVSTAPVSACWSLKAHRSIRRRHLHALHQRLVSLPADVITVLLEDFDHHIWAARRQVWCAWTGVLSFPRS